MRYALALTGAAAALLAASHAAAQAAPPSDARLGQVVDSIVADALTIPIEGISVAVGRGDRLVLARGYGRADVASGRAVEPGTVFEIGSVTKQLTAAAVLKLAEEGRLGLGDPVTRYFPALAGKADSVTLRHLLSHTSGLYSGPPVEDLHQPTDPAAVVGLIAARPAESAPGERYRYNNNAYILLGLLLEQVAGQPYEELIRERFLQPLGMAATVPCGSAPAASLATGYSHPVRGPVVAEAAPRHHPSTSYSAGYLCSTATDLLRWEQALFSGRVLAPESLREMTTPTALTSGRTVPYGYGVFTMQLEGRPYLNHGGNTNGFVATTAHFPADSLSVVVLTNGIYAPAIVDQIEQAISRAALGLPAPAVRKLALSAAERARFVGTYALEQVGTLEVYEQGGHLRLQPPGKQVAARILYQGDNTFVAEHDPAMRIRFSAEGERAAEMVLEQRGRAMPAAKRVP